MAKKEGEERRAFWVAYALSGVGACVLALATIPPDLAIRNLSGWGGLLFSAGLAERIDTGWFALGFILFGMLTSLLGIYVFAQRRRNDIRANASALAQAIQENMRRSGGVGRS